MEKNTKELIDALAHGPVQRYIREHEYQDVQDLVLRNRELFGIPAPRIGEQISTRRKAKEKLPLYYNTPGIIYPPQLNFEQSSSQATAEFKANLVSQLTGKSDAVGADLTAGFGVDTFFFSRAASRMHYVEPDHSLLEIARYNHRLLGASNIEYHDTSAENFLDANSIVFDFVYVDPSRRTAERKKVHAFEHAKPAILSVQDQIFDRAALLIVKASPLLDIQAGLSQLKSVKHVFVVAVANECKELLFVSEKGFNGEAVIHAADIGTQSFDFTFAAERAQAVEYSDPGSYLYEPNAAILKAGAFKTVAARFGLKKLHKNTHFYTSDRLLGSFPGRRFFIEAIVKPDARTVASFFPDGRANVMVRNYPLGTDALKQKTGLEDGGDKFLIGFSGEKKKFVVVAKRI